MGEITTTVALATTEPCPTVYAELLDGDDVMCVCVSLTGRFVASTVLDSPQWWWFESGRGPTTSFNTFDMLRRDK